MFKVFDFQEKSLNICLDQQNITIGLNYALQGIFFLNSVSYNLKDILMNITCA